MTLTQMTYIVAVDRNQSFLKAAEQCNVSQPTLSQQIQKLEDELGAQIFDRASHPITTTNLGQRIVAQAQVTLAEAAKIAHLIQEDVGDLQGTLALGVIPTLAPYLLPLFLQKFSDKHPKLLIRIEELQTDHIVEKIKNRQLDLGLVITPVDDVSLVRQALFLEPFVAFVSAKHPLMKQEKIEAKDLSQKDIYLLKEGHCFREQSLYLCQNRNGTGPDMQHVQFESGSLETLKGFVESGAGYTLLPTLATLKMKGSVQLKPFAAPAPSREVSLVYTTHFSRQKLLGSLAESILQNLPKDLKASPQKLKRLNVAL